jgi:hypothetical protein
MENRGASRWTGWVWRSSQWVRMCKAEKIGECSRLLVKAAPGVRNAFLCLTQGGVPDYRPRSN